MLLSLQPSVLVVAQQRVAPALRRVRRLRRLAEESRGEVATELAAFRAMDFATFELAHFPACDLTAFRHFALLNMVLLFYGAFCYGSTGYGTKLSMVSPESRLANAMKKIRPYRCLFKKYPSKGFERRSYPLWLSIYSRPTVVTKINLFSILIKPICCSFDR